MSPLQRTLAPNVCGAPRLADASQMCGNLLAMHLQGDTTLTPCRRLFTRQQARSAVHVFARLLAMQQAWRGVHDCAQACIAVAWARHGMSAGIHAVSRRTVATHVVASIGATTLVNPRGDEHAPRAREHSPPSHHCCGRCRQYAPTLQLRIASKPPCAQCVLQNALRHCTPNPHGSNAT